MLGITESIKMMIVEPYNDHCNHITPTFDFKYIKKVKDVFIFKNCNVR